MRRRKSNFTFMVVGKKGLGKSTFINTLLNKNIATNHNSDINMYMLDIDCEGIYKNIIAIDTPGLGNINDYKTIEDIVNFIKLQHDKYLSEETKVRRDPAFEDSRVHCLIYFIKPGTCLKENDIKILRTLSPLVNIIPVIAKADALDLYELDHYKRIINKQIKENNITLFNARDGNEMINCGDLEYKIPLAIICDESRTRNNIGATIEVDNPANCDFSLLKEVMFSSHCESLVESTDYDIYENYRSDVLSSLLNE